MEVILGLTTKDSVIIVTSKAALRGITVLKADDDKTLKLTRHSLLAYAGEAGDAVQFTTWIQANIELYHMRNAIELLPNEVANFFRSYLAKALRSRNPYQLNAILGGFNTKTNKPELYYFDHLATKALVPYAAHGYAAYYTLSTFDRHHRPDMTVEEGIALAKVAIDELKTRMPIDFKGFDIRVIDAKGVRDA